MKLSRSDILHTLVFLLGLVFICVTIYLFWPASTNIPIYQSKPSLSYEESIDRIREKQKDDTTIINPICNTRALLHTKVVKKTVVLFHGFTNCPQQFDQLGTYLFEQGYNVYIPRMPYHGYQDRETREIANLTSANLINETGNALDIAAGLGETVSVVGLSQGALQVMWAAMEYDATLDKVIIIAPNIAIYNRPMLVSHIISRGMTIAPGAYFRWVSSDIPIENEGAEINYAYPGFPYRSMGKQLLFGKSLEALSEKKPSKAQTTIFVYNEFDQAINPQPVKTVQKRWILNSTSQIKEYTFSASLQLNHDIIDPNHPQANIGEVYPVLVDLIEN